MRTEYDIRTDFYAAIGEYLSGTLDLNKTENRIAQLQQELKNMGSNLVFADLSTFGPPAPVKSDEDEDEDVDYNSFEEDYNSFEEDDNLDENL